VSASNTDERGVFFQANYLKKKVTSGEISETLYSLFAGFVMTTLA